MTEVIVNELVTIAEVVENSATVEVTENGYTVSIDAAPSIEVSIVENPITVIVEEIIGGGSDVEQGAEFSYDSSGNIVTINYDDGNYLEFTYSGGNVYTITNGVWVKTFEYSDGNLQQITIN